MLTDAADNAQTGAAELENMQVYRAQLGSGSRLMIEADLRRGAPN